MTPKKEIFSTSDLALATFLSLHFELEGIDKNNPHKAVFLFRKSSALDQEVEDFWRGRAQVEVKEYFNQLRVLKSRLYARDY